MAETDESHLTELGGANVTRHWQLRETREPGTRRSLIEAVRSTDVDTEGLMAFGAAESRQIGEVRKYLRGTRAMPAERVCMTGYWRRSS